MGNSAGPKITKDGLALDFDAANTKSYNFYADPYASNVSLHLKMDGANGSTTFTDSSPNAIVVTAVGNAQISTTQSKYNGSAGYFDGTGDYLSIPDSSAPVLGSSDWTIEAWIYISVAKNFNCFYAKRQPGGYGFAVQVDGSNNLTISASINGSSWALPGSSLGSGYVAGAWTHVAVVRSGNTITGYKNGVSTGTQTLSGTIWPSTGYIAAVASGLAGDTSQDFNGYIDNLKISSFARYTSNFTSPPIPSTCTDLTKNKNVGTLTNGVDYNFSNGGSLVFDGVNDYVTVSNSGLFNFGTGDFTIDVWAKVNAYSAGAIQTLINTYTNPSAGWNIQFNVFNTLDFRFSYGDTTLIISGANAILLNQWNNLVISRINNSLIMYVNGRSITTATDSTNISSGSALVLGRCSPSAIQFLNGNISLARIYKARGLSSGEVYNNFVANRGRFFVSTPITLPVSGAALWLDASRQATLFTDAGTTQVATSGQSVYQWNDLSGNNRHATQATLGNRPTWVSPAGGQNGLGTVSFNGSSSFIEGSWQTFTDMTVFVVAKNNTTLSPGGRVFSQSDSTYADNVQSPTTTYIPLGFINGPVAVSTNISNGLILNISFTSNSHTLFIHRKTGTTGSTTVGSTTTSATIGTVTRSMTKYALGKNPNSYDGYWAGAAAEYVVYSRQLDSSEETAIVNYLKTKWGIA